MRLRCALAALALLAGATTAAAHPAPFSYLDIVFRNGNIEGTLVVHIIDVAHELGVVPPEKLLDETLIEQQRQRIGEILGPRIVAAHRPPADGAVESIELLREDAALSLRYRIPRRQPAR